MSECIAEDDLLDLATARRSLGDAPVLEAHLAACPACSGLLCTLLATPDDDVPRTDRAGETLGPYRLDALVGAGAMGEVYRAWDLRLHRHVAVKVLSRPLGEAPDRIRRLESEARAAAAITHPNVVTVYDTGTDDGVAYVVSELITGESLRSVIDRGPIAPRTALDLGLQLARGLAAAHAQGVVHRDLKPGNLIVADGGTLKILDFGLAKLGGDRDVEATEPGALLGTSGYLSPEQARGEPADARSDLFAVGAILHELFTGRRAFDGATFAERLSAVLRDTPAPIDHPVGPIVARCLEKDPRKRFQTANDLAWVLDSLGRDDTPVRPAATPRARAAVSRRTFVVGAAITGAAGVLLGRALTRRPAPHPFQPAYRQLTFRHGRVGRARFTRDGGSLIYGAVWDEERSAVFTTRLAGGGTRTLDLPSAELLAVSSRGELALSLDHRYAGGFHQSGQLAVAPVEGGAPRALGIDVQDADFTPDGAQLAIVRRVAGRFRLELPIGRVLLEAGWLAHPRVSPAGDTVACLMYAGPDDDQGAVMVVPRAGGPARMVDDVWSSVDGLAWAPDGRALWISASREGGNNAVRAIALDGRQLAHIPSAGRLRLHDAAPHGQLAVTHVSGRLRMMTRLPGAPADVDLALSDVTLAGDIAADGRSIVFTEFGDVDTANGAYLRRTGGGDAIRLARAMACDLADDGRGVLALLYDEPDALAVLPETAGQPRRVPLPGLRAIKWARWCPGDRILVAAARSGGDVRVWRIDPDQTQTPLTDDGVVGPCAVSRDGRAALIAGDRLLVVDVAAGGPPRAVPGAFADRCVCGWSAAGEVYVRTTTAPIEVRRVDPDTGMAVAVRELAPPRLGLRGVFTVAISESGDAYTYSFGQEQSRLYSMAIEEPTP